MGARSCYPLPHRGLATCVTWAGELRQMVPAGQVPTGFNVRMSTI